MSPATPEVIAALSRLSEAMAVVYTEGMLRPTPVTYAGDYKGQPYYMLGTGPHLFNRSGEFEIEPSGAVVFTDPGGENLYFTTAKEAKETTPEQVAVQIASAREWIDENGGLEKILAFLG